MPKRAETIRKKPGTLDGKRYPLNMRTTFEVRQELEKAAAATGRSLAQEAEYRIQRTFENQRMLQEALDISFGSDISGLLMIIGDVMRATAQTVSFAKDGDPSLEIWSEDPVVYDEVAKAVATVFAEHRPVGGILPPSKMAPASRATASDIAQGIAIKRMAELERSATKARKGGSR
jgi:hypothetical protein